MDLAEKDAYIAEHLMKLEPDTLRFMVADLTSEVTRLQLSERTAYERGRLDVKVEAKHIAHVELKLWGSGPGEDAFGARAACHAIIGGIDNIIVTL